MRKDVVSIFAIFYEKTMQHIPNEFIQKQICRELSAFMDGNFEEIPKLYDANHVEDVQEPIKEHRVKINIISDNELQRLRMCEEELLRLKMERRI